jgi:hypothetical protein
MYIHKYIMYKGNQGLVKMQIPVLNKSKGVRRRIELQGPIDWYEYVCLFSLLIQDLLVCINYVLGPQIL